MTEDQKYWMGTGILLIIVIILALGMSFFTGKTIGRQALEQELVNSGIADYNTNFIPNRWYIIQEGE